jgi:uncharacterized membrane protein YvbJ
MNRSPCPDCRKMISATANVCPLCGHVFKEGERAAQQQAFEAKVAADSKKGLIYALIGAVILLLYVLFSVSLKESDEKFRTRQLEKMKQVGRDMYK